MPVSKSLVGVLLAALLAALGAPVGAAEDPPSGVPESPTGSYVVLMGEDPVVASVGRDAVRTPPGLERARELRESHSRALAAARVPESARVHDYTVALNGFSVITDHDSAERLARQPGVVAVLPDELRHPATDASPEFLGLTGPQGVWEGLGYTGEGVVVGVIDTGIWPEHPSFADDGSYPAPPVTLDETERPACEFGNSAHNPADAEFTCTNKLIGARQMLDTYRTLIGADPDEYDSARDDDGHGTHTASTAAGNAGVKAEIYGLPLGTVSGIAPRAHIIAYKGLGNLGGFTSDLAAAIDQAVTDGVDVINYSVGGGASLVSADAIAYLFAADAGVHVAASAGNSGPGEATMGGPAAVPWLTAVGASTQPRFFAGTVRLGNGTEITGASITEGTRRLRLVDAADAGSPLCIPGELRRGVVRGKIVLCERGQIGRAEKSLAVAEAGGAGMILFNTTDTDNLFTDTHWVPSVHVDYTDGLAVKAYIASSRRPTAEIVDTGRTETWEPAPSMTIFSSRGPNPVAGDIIKPDVTAPGLQILAGASPTPDPGMYPGELFQAIAGTSMSAPHVAGLLALIDEAHPDWSPAAARSALMTTADPDVVDNDRTSPADPFDMGAGHVDPGGAAGVGSPFDPGIVYDAGLLEYFGFLCGAAPEIFVDPEGTCSSLAGAGVPTDPSDLNLPSIGIAEVAGAQTVTRTVSNVSGRALRLTPTVEAPEGFTVEVSPATLVVPAQGTASYTVRVTNTSAPIGEWRFGSLTWSSTRRGVEARSPLAVRASLFDAPAEVTGTGETGSVSFDVTFGYSGSYTAAGHGLVPATDFVGNVAQDPDQTFDPSDVGNGAVAHEIPVSGAHHLRLAMPPEATEAEADIDLFLFDPSGALVASSTNGATDEQIDVVSPADGTWTVYVHGWSAPGGDSPYTLSTWVIPAAPGGSLTVDSAPESATLGETGSVTASWTGATSAWYLGAVSHTGDDGLLGLTLVSVDTR